MKIAITGSGGMLGKFIFEQALSAGHQVIPIQFSQKKSNYFLDFILNNLVPLQNCDYVIHCAASKNPKTSFEKYLNIKVPLIIQEYISQYQLSCHFIHISSLNVVFDALKDNYTNSKRQGEYLLDSKRTSIIRPGLIWSPRNDPKIQKIQAYLNNSYLPHLMIKPGNLYNPVDPFSLAYFLINNLSSFRDSPQTFNILGNKKLTLWDLINSLPKRKKIKIYPILTNSFQFLPIRFLIQNSFFGDMLNQFLTIDRTVLPSNCTGSLIRLPHKEL